MNCPNEHGIMKKEKRVEQTTFRGLDVTYEVELWKCEFCGLEGEDLSLAAENQHSLAEAYRKTAGLLTGAAIAEARKQHGWSQEELAKVINVGVASVKRWERGQVQTPVMDQALRAAFAGKQKNCDPYTGNRELSVARIKLALIALGTLLERDMLEGKRNRLLYGAKYLWYADMVSFRETGRGITGASYAALPQGPQLNNYAELIGLIREADETSVAPLTDQEERILRRIVMRFPKDKAIYDASHREKAWVNRKIGTLIPYSDAHTLTEI